MTAVADKIIDTCPYDVEILPGSRFIKLRGNTRNNADYQKAKRPVGEWKHSPPMTDSEIHNHLNQGGWIGAVIPQNFILVDIDDSIQGELVKGLLEGENVHHHCIKTPNGWQFVFKAEQEETKSINQITKFFTQIGVVIDTRTAGAGYIVFPTSNTQGRYIVTKSIEQLDELPHFLKPIRNSKMVKDKTTNEPYVFPVPIQESGSRNDTLYKFATHLKVWNVSTEEIFRAMELIYTYFLLDKTDFPFSEIKTIAQSAINWKPNSPKQGELSWDYVPEDDFSQNAPNVFIPLPFQISKNTLFKKVVKKVDGFEVEQDVMVSRTAPIILRELSSIERNSVHYEISWKDRGMEKREVVPASTISTKRELMILADHGLPVNDLNYKDLIKFFDSYLAFNRIEQSYMVERLGHIKEAFIHPLQSQGIEILPNDSGERQLLEAFQIKGTVESWKTEVFERIKNHPKVLFLVFASFASVILRDLKITPFIVDLSGSTSQGKTTAMQVARSVWGNESLISEWNATKVSIERKAGFLNSFPLYLDDTRKADERILQSIVYQFSGGRSKGRGSLKGSQTEATWNNILISTGEVSLADYAAKAGGAAARIISLVDEPFVSASHQYFSGLYEAISDNYGAIGLEFISHWERQKESLLTEFYRFKENYLKKAIGSDVLTRLSMYYAAIHFAGSVAKKVFQLDVDLTQLDRLFDKNAAENKTLDKPKELLEQILTDLDASRRDIFYQYEPNDIKAIYHFNTICLMPAYLKEFLGSEEKMIRREWMKRGFVQADENRGISVDYKQVKHEGRKFRTVVINPTFIDQMGIDFSRDFEM